jgi:hypothetical protein
MPTSPPSRLEIAVVGAALLVFLADAISLLTAGPATLSGLPLDDAWIHLSYARAFAETGVFGYNPGEWQNGSTAPLWSLLLALPLKAGLEPAVAARSLGLLAGGASLLLAWGAARSLGGPRLAALTIVALVLDPWTGILAVSGMETQAAMAASFACVLALLHERWTLGGLALAAGGLLRPELGLLVPAALVLAPTNRARASVLIPPALAGGAWLLFGVLVAGHPLPNAFRTKVVVGFEPVEQLASVWGLFSAAPREWGATGWLLLLLALAGGGLGARELLRRGRLAVLLVAVPLALLGFYVVSLPLGVSAEPIVQASVQSIYYARYLLLVLPWFALWGGAGALAAWERSASGPGRLAVAAAVVVVLLGVARTERSALKEAYVANTAEIEALHGAMAAWIATNLPSDAVIGISDAGRLRYSVPQRLIDLTGLNTSALLDVDDDVAWLIEHGMTHAAIWPGWHRALLEDPRLTWTPMGATEVERNTIAARPRLVLYRVSGAGD